MILRRGRRRSVPPPPLEDIPFVDSASYWERRYASGGNSGPGSYELLSTFKAATLNRFVAEHSISTVLELGCGDGHQLSLAKYPSYVGLDVAPTAVDRCIEAFRDDPTKSFFRYDPVRFIDRDGVFRAELALSLDVVFHLVEDEVFERYMSILFDCATRFVCVYSSNDEAPDLGEHVRNRRFTTWVTQHRPEWRLCAQVPNPHRDQEGVVSDFWFFAAPTRGS